MVPVVVMVSVPVKAGVGALPMSPPAVPETVVAPVLVIPAPASTAKVELVPSGTGVTALELVVFMKTLAVAIAITAITGTPNLTVFGIGFFVATRPPR
jgi:hypothetical protein